MSGGCRIALRFARDERLLSLGHSEAMTMWQECLRASGLPFAQSEGRAPRIRFTLAAPLPAGYTSEYELAELHFAEWVRPGEALSAVRPVLGEGLRALDVRLMPEGEPSLQSQVKFAEYRILGALGTSAERLEAAIYDFFARDSCPWEEAFDGRVKRFDLRDLVDDLWVEQSEAGTALGMRLDATSTGTGRPDSVLAALPLDAVTRKHRTRLLLSHLPNAVKLWLRRGRFESERAER